jgi:disulfide bond formation protein DsbB
MDVEAMQLFTALLSIIAMLGAVALLITRLLASRVALAAEVGAAVSRVALPLAWVVALGSTLGSLYFSEVANYAPCKMCWYQRIAMYPLAVILFVAMLRRDRSVAWYAVPLAAIGAAVAAYHRLVEWKPSIDAGGCAIDVPCTVPWFTSFGFVTLATMAFFGFISIIVFLTVRFPEPLGGEGSRGVSPAVDQYAGAPATED